MNVRLLRKIQKTILRRYKQLRMDEWFKFVPGAGDCGTMACIAGWAITLSNKWTKKKPLLAARRLFRGFGANLDSLVGHGVNSVIQPKAGRLLGLSSDQSNRLFVIDNWPIEFRVKVSHLKWRSWTPGHKPGTKRYARVVADRIEHFIKTNGEE